MQEQLPREGLLGLSLPSPLRGRRCAAFKFAPGESVETYIFIYFSMG